MSAEDAIEDGVLPMDRNRVIKSATFLRLCPMQIYAKILRAQNEEYKFSCKCVRNGSMGVLSLRVERENSVFIEVWRVQSFQNGNQIDFLITKPPDYHTRIS